jgi:hypothetical protein
MKRLSMRACVATGILAVAACGGSGDASVGGGDDGGADALADTGGGQDATADASGHPDSAADTGGGGVDSGPVNDGAASSDGGGDGAPPTDGGNPLPDGGVASIPGVVLWLDAAQGVTSAAGKVSAWADQSGNHNDANQQNANWQPTLRATGIDGLPSVHFTEDAAPDGGVASYGNMMNVADSATLQWGTGDYLVEIVTRYDNVPSALPAGGAAVGYGTFYSKQSQGSAAIAGVGFFGNTPSTATVAGTTAFSSFVDPAHGVSNTTLGFNDNTARLLATQRTGGTTLALRVNGAQTTTAPVPSTDVGETAVGVRIGASGDASTARLDGDIAEMIAVKGTISTADLSAIETYLITKYGL